SGPPPPPSPTSSITSHDYLHHARFVGYFQPGPCAPRGRQLFLAPARTQAFTLSMRALLSAGLLSGIRCRVLVDSRRPISLDPGGGMSPAFTTFMRLVYAVACEEKSIMSFLPGLWQSAPQQDE